jgi:hypothetical protein
MRERASGIRPELAPNKQTPEPDYDRCSLLAQLCVSSTLFVCTGASTRHGSVQLTDTGRMLSLVGAVVPSGKLTVLAPTAITAAPKPV